MGLERPQKIDDFLLLPSAQLIGTFDDSICLAATAPVISDGVNQVDDSSVMEEQDTLSSAFLIMNEQLTHPRNGDPIITKRS